MSNIIKNRAKRWLPLFICTVSLLACNEASLADSQSEENAQATAATDKAEIKLNQSFKNLIAKFPANQIFISKLKTSQAAWIGYRDAHLKAIFPADKPKDEYGESYVYCYQTELLKQMESRSAHLASLSGVCSIDTTQAKNDCEREEKLMNATYSQANSKIASRDSHFLQEAQSEWLAFRDAEVDTQTTLANSKNREAMRLKTRADLDALRTRELNDWVNAYKGKAACCGSRPAN